MDPQRANECVERQQIIGVPPKSRQQILALGAQSRQAKVIAA